MPKKKVIKKKTIKKKRPMPRSRESQDSYYKRILKNRRAT